MFKWSKQDIQLKKNGFQYDSIDFIVFVQLSLVSKLYKTNKMLNELDNGVK